MNRAKESTMIREEHWINGQKGYLMQLQFSDGSSEYIFLWRGEVIGADPDKAKALWEASEVLRLLAPGNCGWVHEAITVIALAGAALVAYPCLIASLALEHVLGRRKAREAAQCATERPEA